MIRLVRVKRAEDEPKCEALRQENTALMEQVIAYKDRQMSFLQDVEGLKQEKAALVAEKVHCAPAVSLTRVVTNVPAGEGEQRDEHGVGEHLAHAFAYCAVPGTYQAQYLRYGVRSGRRQAYGGCERGQDARLADKDLRAAQH